VSRALATAHGEKSVQDAIRALGYEPVPNTPAQFADVIRSDLEKWRKVVREANVKAD
jgi:tripartite-type tricarboxylate transporter receptor subunit TctC